MLTLRDERVVASTMLRSRLALPMGVAGAESQTFGFTRSKSTSSSSSSSSSLSSSSFFSSNQKHLCLGKRDEFHHQREPLVFLLLLLLLLSVLLVGIVVATHAVFYVRVEQNYPSQVSRRREGRFESLRLKTSSRRPTRDPTRRSSKRAKKQIAV